MAPIRYSLHYEDYSEHLMSRFGKLLQMQSLVDMTLMCSSHTLRVHKSVLAASSAYFQEVLQKQTGEPLIILKMRFSVLKCLVEFMYCGKTQCLEENLDELVSAAQFLKIKGLSKEGEHKPAPQQLQAPASNTQPLDAFGRPNKDAVVRIPFDIENGSSSSKVDYADMPRAMKPRRGRPTVRRPGGWEGAGPLSRAAERALMRREQDSRKAIHQLKHLQTRHMQDYMDRVTLSQAVNSICGPETSSSYMNMDNDLMYMNQDSSNIGPSMPFGKEKNMKDNIPSSYPNASSSNATNDTGGDGINNAMSQYVNALKNAGLPTDLPILFESGDGSYINVNEQVLLDMVQSSEIQYEVIEQPNIIEKVADPSEIKSIDDLSKSIERGEMMQGNKSYSMSADFDKDTDYNRTDDGMNSLNTILPDNLEAYAEQQNFVVMDPRLQENSNPLDHVSSNDFSCIDGDMQFFTKSMSDDVKKYYEEQQLAEARVMEQLCPTSSSLDTNFSMSLLNAKSSQLAENLSQSYDTLNTDDLRRTEDCYDFTLPLPQSNDFKEELDCLIATPRRNDDDGNSFELNSQLARERAQAKADIIKDLMSIETKMNLGQEKETTDDDKETSHIDSAVPGFGNTVDDNGNDSNEFQKHEDFPSGLTSNIQWDMDMDECRNSENDTNNENSETANSGTKYSMIDLTGPVGDKTEVWHSVMDNEESADKENESPNSNERSDQGIPYAVGLLPMKPTQPTDETSLLKRRSSTDLDSDAKCLKRRAKKKI
ncbi:putative fruitless [Operophtera brumata]|uniref:Putative fruitless n=1 Tax=Operophtera brumata TaxID=104452 RepID=A0A0L7LJ30_OPEBR|nr:putative fruitless [Operophtera brumata]